MADHRVLLFAALYLVGLLVKSTTTAFAPKATTTHGTATSFAVPHFQRRKIAQHHPRPNTSSSKRGATSPVVLSLTTSSSPSSTTASRIGETDLQTLSDQNYVIIPNFISPDLISSLKTDVDTLRQQNKFNVAKIGQDTTNTLNTDIRIAETCFLGQNKLSDVPNESRDELYNILDTLREDLSGNSILDVVDESGGELIKAAPALDEKLSELLYAYYPKGGYYRRHLDAVEESASVLRCYSFLLYLNEGWKVGDGGELRLHMDGGGDFIPKDAKPNYLDVQPLGGTLVLFKSSKIPHEVLDTNNQRLAIVGWYNRGVTTSDITALSSEEDRVRLGMLLVAGVMVMGGLISIVLG